MIPFNYDKPQFSVSVHGHHVSIRSIAGNTHSGDTPSARRNFKIAYNAMLDRMGLYGFLASPGHRMALEECLAVENPKIIVMSPCDCHALNNSAKLDADVNVLLVPEQSLRAFHITPTVEIYVDSHLERDDKFAVTQPRLFNDNDNWWMTPPPDFKVISFGQVLTTLGSNLSDKDFVSAVYPKSYAAHTGNDVYVVRSGGDLSVTLGASGLSVADAWYNARCAIQGVTA